MRRNEVIICKLGKKCQITQKPKINKLVRRDQLLSGDWWRVRSL